MVGTIRPSKVNAKAFSAALGRRAALGSREGGPVPIDAVPGSVARVARDEATARGRVGAPGQPGQVVVRSVAQVDLPLSNPIMR